MDFRLVIDKNKKEEVVATVHERNGLIDEIETLIMSYEGADRITAYTEDNIIKLAYRDIECVTVVSGKTYAIDKKGDRYMIRKRLYEIEAMLPGNFIRINKSAIANQNEIEKFRLSFNGAVDAVFYSGYNDYVSRRCFSQIKRKLYQNA